MRSRSRRLRSPGFKAQVALALGVPHDASGWLWLLRGFFRPPRPGQPDRVLLFLMAVARNLKQRLGVPVRPFWFEWILCFLFRPPRTGREERLLRGARAFMQECARRLGVRRVRHGREWLWRSFVRSPAAPPVWRAFARALGVLLRPVRWGAHWVSVGLNAAFPPAVREWSMQAIEAMLSQPGYSKFVLASGAVLAAGFISLAVSAPMSQDSQAAFLVLLLALAFLIRVMPGRLVTLILMVLSLAASARYIWWRTTQTLAFPGVTEAFVGYALFMAECYTWLILLLGYVQTCWPLKRRVAPLPADPALWPTVDVFIPTYNEPLVVVKPAIYAAQGMDWPADKLRIYILDDGKRAEFRDFAAEVGVGYVTRDDNRGAKAGNINHALRETHGEFVAIFDCDHVPVRSFLQCTMGTMVADEKCALVQTPHYFFSRDSFQRNLDMPPLAPEEGRLFYGLIQDGNDLWDATYFCGSCAVIRRAPLEQVGGIATETVTEDAHTSLRLHRLGYRSAYLATIQAAGLATETLADHISQRIRWARGMAQIFRTDNPFFGKGLSFAQRLCYSNAMLHFFYGVPRLIFLLAPTAYLLFQLHFLDASALALVVFVLPHLVLANVATSRMQGRYRRSFWAEVYETALAWYIVLPTTVAFLNPRYGKFNVTSKGQNIAHGYRDWHVSLPYLALCAINLVDFSAGLLRLWWGTNDSPTVLINMFWAFYNLIILGVTISVAREVRQARGAPRVSVRMPAALALPDGHLVACETVDYSVSGLGLRVAPQVQPLQEGMQVSVVLGVGSRDEVVFPARLVRVAGDELGVAYEAMTLAQERALVQSTFGRADAWLVPDLDARERVWGSMASVFRSSAVGYLNLGRDVARACVSLVVPGRVSRSRP